MSVQIIRCHFIDNIVYPAAVRVRRILEPSKTVGWSLPSVVRMWQPAIVQRVPLEINRQRASLDMLHYILKYSREKTSSWIFHREIWAMELFMDRHKYVRTAYYLVSSCSSLSCFVLKIPRNSMHDFSKFRSIRAEFYGRSNWGPAPHSDFKSFELSTGCCTRYESKY